MITQKRHLENQGGLSGEGVILGVNPQMKISATLTL